MLGFYIPTFDYLDFLTVEVEHFGSMALPSFDKKAYHNLPQPGTHKGEMETLWDDPRRRRDDWKWVVAGKRSFGGWGLVLQAGTDHMKLLDEGGGEFNDVMTKPSQWYTQVRFFAGIR